MAEQHRQESSESRYWELVITHEAEIRQVKEEIKVIKDLVKELEKELSDLMSERAKLIGWCAGVSGIIAVLVKFFWPLVK